ncbi:hypothetical protein [Caballeronia sp. LZ035]|uniref:hypothetical protein n=1 Tax=Caballeronia sp. LZ035 TaxID=3038568 RepID=UPI002862A37A|nr:hypothetical protein [Caballeronia sp. LZ035]MDR5760930.1 hypothetical protein [Caballeronia sp. LZ035]
MNSDLLFHSRTRHWLRRFAHARTFAIAAAMAFGTLAAAPAAMADDATSRDTGNGDSRRTEYIYVGDNGDPSDSTDDAIKRVNLADGTVSVFSRPDSPAAFLGINGLIFNHGELLAVNQNNSLPGGGNGSVFRLNGGSGAFTDYLIEPLNAPYAPQGIVFGGGNRDWRHPWQPDHYYIANILKSGETCEKVDEGDVFEYGEWGGRPIRVLNHGNKPALFNANFYPRGVVFGPDGMLYVSARGCPAVPSTDPRTLLAYILRFDPQTHALDAVIVTNETVNAQHLGYSLHRPEGLVFDDQGYLWVTSFIDGTAAANPNDRNNVDRIIKIDVRSRKVIDSIPLWKAGKDRASAQALIFGPGGKLYIPISGNTPDTAGELRRCDTRTKQCEAFVKVGKGLVAPWFAIFKNSDPATLRYVPH